MVCLHPGQGPCTSATDILRSWQGILSHPESPRVRCVDEWVVGRAGLAIVVCREILANGQLMATNTYARTERGLAHGRPSFRPGARGRAADRPPPQPPRPCPTGASCTSRRRG